jgi:hypothetical protein
MKGQNVYYENLRLKGKLLLFTPMEKLYNCPIFKGGKVKFALDYLSLEYDIDMLFCRF